LSTAKEKVSLVSLGCPKNLVDAEVMLGYLANEKYEITTDERDADIIIVNTCSFIKEAKQESIDTILDLADRKHDARCRLLIVTGCLPQRYQEELARELPEVDIFVGTGDYPRIAEIIAEKEGTDEQLRYVGDPNLIYDENLPRLKSSPSYTAYLKIAEGCSNCCSYCVIPSLRGSFRSRPLARLLEEARSLVAGGVKEINLIAQDITGYGQDLPEQPNQHWRNLSGNWRNLKALPGSDSSMPIPTGYGTASSRSSGPNPRYANTWISPSSTSAIRSCGI